MQAGCLVYFVQLSYFSGPTFDIAVHNILIQFFSTDKAPPNLVLENNVYFLNTNWV